MLWTLYPSLEKVFTKSCLNQGTHEFRADFEGNSQYENTWKKDDDGGVISDQPRITVGECGMPTQGGYITRYSAGQHSGDNRQHASNALTQISG